MRESKLELSVNVNPEFKDLLKELGDKIDELKKEYATVEDFADLENKFVNLVVMVIEGFKEFGERLDKVTKALEDDGK